MHFNFCFSTPALVHTCDTSPALLQALQERTIPSFHALLSPYVSIICPQDWKSWANLNPEPVWVGMISSLQRKKVTESILNLSACSLSTSQMFFFLRPKAQLPGSHHTVVFTIEISEENGQIQHIFQVSSNKGGRTVTLLKLNHKTLKLEEFCVRKA